MFLSKLKTTVLSLSLVIGSSDATARPVVSEELIAATRLPRHADVDVLPIRSCNGQEKEKITSIRLRVKNRSARIDRLMIVYRNGRKHDLPLRRYFHENSHSRWIDLRGDARCVQRIKVVGSQTDGRGGQAHIEILARIER